MFRRHPILSVVTLAYLAVVGVLTLAPMPNIGRDSILWRLVDLFDRFAATRWLDYSSVEFLANVAMFVPLGIFLVLLFGRRRWWLGILVGVGLTLAIELVQQVLPTRVPDPRDLVANTIGASVGVLIALVMTAGDARRVRAKARYSSS